MKLSIWWLLSFIAIVSTLGCSVKGKSNLPTADRENIVLNEEVNNNGFENDFEFNGWITKTVQRWNEYNLFTITSEETLTKAEYVIFTADETLFVFDYNDGKTLVGIVEPKSKYLGIAVTRFQIEPTDKNWNWFLVVKFQDGEGFWDGIINISMAQFYEYLQNNMLFFNTQSNELFKSNELLRSIAVITSIGRKPVSIYFVDNINKRIKITDSELMESALPEEIYSKYFISLNLKEILNKYEYIFKIGSDEIQIGFLTWNIQTDKINVEIKPINTITGREWEL
jgi:hypothetical protein